MKDILAVDVGGTNVKILVSGQDKPRKVASGPTMTAKQMVGAVKDLTADWKYDAVSIGYPGPVLHGKPFREPHNLVPGAGYWLGFCHDRGWRTSAHGTGSSSLQENDLRRLRWLAGLETFRQEKVAELREGRGRAVGGSA